MSNAGWGGFVAPEFETEFPGRKETIATVDEPPPAQGREQSRSGTNTGAFAVLTAFNLIREGARFETWPKLVTHSLVTFREKVELRAGSPTMEAWTG